MMRGGFAPQMPVRHRRYITKVARKDLHCNKGSLKIATKGENHYEVRGCNGVVAYTISCVNHGPCSTKMTKVPTPIVKGE